jgi:hypothetical protein
LNPARESERDALVEQLDAYREFYAAWWEVEKGVTDFDLHAKVVERFREAQDGVARLESNPASTPDARTKEQKQAADRRDDWLAKQLDGILEDAEALFRAIGSGSGQSGGEAQSARALLANLRDARAALNPATNPEASERASNSETGSDRASHAGHDLAVSARSETSDPAKEPNDA